MVDQGSLFDAPRTPGPGRRLPPSQRTQELTRAREAATVRAILAESFELLAEATDIAAEVRRLALDRPGPGVEGGP